jgi:hypothetical protein
MDKQPLKKRRLAAATLSYKDEMESELNKTLPKRGLGSRHVQPVPFTEESTSSEPAPIPTLPITKRGLGSCPAQSALRSEEVAAPVEVQPSTPSFDGPSNYGSRGVYPEGYDYGERYGGRLFTRFNSSLVDDEEADARVEWLYQGQRQASRVPPYEGPYTHPFPSARGGGLRASFDDRQRESQAIPAFDHIEKVMERMERHLAASTSASMASSAQHHALPGQGKFHSFHYSLNCLKLLVLRIFFHRVWGFTPLSTLMESVWTAMLVACPIWFRLEASSVSPSVCL